MKKVITIIGIFGLILVQAQVGINNDNPEATLDIKSEGNLSGTKALKITNSANTEIVTVKDEGKVGIGTATPSEKLHVMGNGIFRNNDQVQLELISDATTTGASSSIKMVNGTSKKGWLTVLGGGGNLTPDDYSIYTFKTDVPGFNYNRRLIINYDTGNVGIGTALSATSKLEISGDIKIADGTQGAGKVLTSDATGKASWQTPAKVVSTVSTQLGAGITITNANKDQWLDTGTTITLPPGKWVVTASLVFTSSMTNGATYEGGAWIRATWCDSPTATSKSADIMSGSYLISGGLAWNMAHGSMIGSVIINNTTTSDKIYHLKTLGGTDGIILPANMEIINFGGVANAENTIIGQRLD